MYSELTVADLQGTVEQNLKNDGYLVPAVFICSEKGAHIVDAHEYFESDDKKDELVSQIARLAIELNAYKILMVSEGWMYDSDNLSQKEIERLTESDAYREKLPRYEVYQIMEVTGEKVDMVCRKFHRNDDDEIILDGVVNITSDTYEGRFSSWQNCLRTIN